MNTTSPQRLATRVVLAEIGRLLDRVETDRSGLDAAERLACVGLARQVRGRIDTLAAVLLAEADQTQAALKATGTPTRSWLGLHNGLSGREAAGALHEAHNAAKHARVAQAATTGRIGLGQAKAINTVLDTIAPRLDQGQQQTAEDLLLGLADELDADQLTGSAARVLAEVAPATAAEDHEQLLQRQAETARRNRSLRFFADGQGSIRFDGSLPKLEAQAWIAQLDAIAEQQRRTVLEARDPLAETRTPAQRKADALTSWINTKTSQPGTAGPTARVLVHLDYEALQQGAAGAGTLPDGQPLSAGELRRACCDAEIIPAVLGAASEPLDLGRTQRLVSPALRLALIARDGGCIFPGCHSRPAQCEAHHVVPWHEGGPTAINNLVLLCHAHHALIEPAKGAIRDQWQIQIGPNGKPQTIPPARINPNRTPIRAGKIRADTG